MLVSLNFVDTFITLPRVAGSRAFDVARFAPLLTKQGFEVESVTIFGEHLKGVVVGKIEDCKRHPSADKLQVCTVNVGAASSLQIVCGASNARVGLFVAVATVGNVLPGNKEIKAATIRDVPSHGMLCSRDELGLLKKADCDPDGIWELNVDIQGGAADEVLQKNLGKPVVEVLGLDDVLLELNVTPNRPDMLSHIGVARELEVGFAFHGIPFEKKNPTRAKKAKLETSELAKTVLDSNVVKFSDTKVKVENALGAPAFFVGLENVKVTQTPAWLRNQLEVLGQNSINAVVDASNYVLLAYGQPSHAFDVKKLSAKDGSVEMSLRFAAQSEKFTALDGKTRELIATDCVVADATKVHALLGVIGGDDSKVDLNSHSLLLEFANPSAVAVRRSSRRVGRITDASFRFEKGIDTSARFDAALELIGLVSELTGGSFKYIGACHSTLKTPRSEAAKEFVSDAELAAAAGPALKANVCVDFSVGIDKPVALGSEQKAHVEAMLKRHTVAFSKDCQLRVLGAELVPNEKALGILNSLGFEKLGGDAAKQDFKIPHWRRHDIQGFADLVEEIARVVGIDSIPSVPVAANPQETKDDKHIEVFERVANKTATLGYTEVIGLHFMREDDLTGLGLANNAALGEPVRLLNPIIADEPLMHSTLVTGLLRKVVHNLNYGTTRGQIFEIARTFQNLTTDSKPFFNETLAFQVASDEYSPRAAFLYTKEKQPKLRPAETPRLAGIVFGNRDEKNWFNEKPVPFDLFTLVAHVEEICKTLGVKVEFKKLPSSHCYFKALHPGRSAQVIVRGPGDLEESIGWVGAFHPAALRHFGIESTCLGFELNLATLFKQHVGGTSSTRKASQPRRFPSVNRDFAFLLAENISAGQLEDTVKVAISQTASDVPVVLQSVRVFDLYRGKGVAEGKKSVAFQISMFPTQRTLVDSEIVKVTEAVVKAVTEKCGGELRG